MKIQFAIWYAICVWLAQMSCSLFAIVFDLSNSFAICICRGQNFRKFSHRSRENESHTCGWRVKFTNESTKRFTFSATQPVKWKFKIQKLWLINNWRKLPINFSTILPGQGENEIEFFFYLKMRTVLTHSLE